MRWLAGLLTVTVGAGGFAGCHTLLPLGISPGQDRSPSEAPLKHDRADTPADMPIVKPDRDPDAVVKPDRRPDGPVAKQDRLVDGAVAKSDTQPDAAIKPDVTPAGDGPPGACANNAQLVQTYAANMVRCWQASGKTQCQAKNLCGPTWHLCTAAEFLGAGGQTKASTGQGWLASCVRDGLDVQAPTGAICSSCNAGGPNIDQDFIWDCMGNTVSTAPYDYLGVYASGELYRVGTSTTPCAYWSAGVSAAGLQGAICCGP
jgi:hypothetical protein